MVTILSGASTIIDHSAVFAKAATPSTIVSTELINYYSMTSSEVQTFIATLHNQGITTLTVRINSYNEFKSNSNTAIAKIKAIIPVAMRKEFPLTSICTLGILHGITALGILHRIQLPIVTPT